MGGYYARAEGLQEVIADAIRDHYRPAGQGDEVPTAPVTVAVSLADKLDTLVGFFFYHEVPTGSKDPFALRRAALSVLRTLERNSLRMPLMEVSDTAVALVAETWRRNRTGSGAFGRALLSRPGLGQHDAQSYTLLDFFADRLKVQQREAGVRHDLIDAVFALGNEDDLVRLLARVKALQNFIATEDGANLLAAYKRAANILKKEQWHGTEGEIPRTGEEDPLAVVDDPDLWPVIRDKMAERHAGHDAQALEPAEAALVEALDRAEPEATAAVGREDFEAAMQALAALRAPIDRFFDEVTVNTDDPARRAARLDLLARFRAAVHNVADFSRIEG
jgi:glycyl-tRNA synthetase beta chain